MPDFLSAFFYLHFGSVLNPSTENKSRINPPLIPYSIYLISPPASVVLLLAPGFGIILPETSSKLPATSPWVIALICSE
ncbi:MAG: hypothetical protein A2V66_05540 [Ignavibacteria bacterium RBG_13_36_8]|nr:MAG: hypothetical protein A2V66_05540 [Ignavibacteria bacterium RBG_13_36_8]